MKSISRRTRREILLTALIGAVLSSCSDVVAPEEGGLAPGGVEANLLGLSALGITPPGPLTLIPGDTVHLHVSPVAGALRYSSSDSTVAAVDELGVVTAFKPGSAQIIVVSARDPQVAGVVLIQVGTRGASSITVDSLGVAGETFDAENVRSQLLVKVGLQRGDATRLEILFDDAVVCAGDLRRTAALEQVPVRETARCDFDTAAYDSASGLPFFRNGTVSLTARLLGSGRTVLASSPARQVRLANHDTLAVAILPERSATGEDGRVWFGGSLTLVATPVLYSGASTVGAVTFEYFGSVGRRFHGVDESAPYRLTFPAANLARALDEAATVEVSTSQPVGSDRRLTGQLTGIRYDGVPPAVGRLVRNEWVGANVLFASLFLSDADSDVGVGGVRPNFKVGPTSSSFAQILAIGMPVTRGGDLQPSMKNFYRVAYQVCDALANCSDGTGFDFGVDLQPPTFVSINMPPRVVGPTDDLRIALADDRSDFSSTPLEVVTYSYRPGGPAVPGCGSIAGITLPGTPGSGICLGERVGTVIPVPREQEGYYIYRITAVDVAGNRSQPIERAFLVDGGAPVVSSFTVPTQFTPAANAVFRATATDNVDLADVRFGLIFGSGDSSFELPLTTSIPAGQPFTGELSRQADVTGQLPFIRTLTLDSRTTLLVDRASAIVRDASGRVTRSIRPIPVGTFGGNSTTTNPFPGVSSIQLTTAPCTELCTLAQDGVTNLTLRITGDAGLSPFARVFLFVRAPDGEVSRVGSTARFSVVDTGTQRTYTYALSYAGGTGSVGTHTLFAVAMNAGGNALKSSELAIQPGR